MAALTRDINTPERRGEFVRLPVAAQTTIYGGAIVALNAEGFAVPGQTATGLKAVGCAQERAVNLGEDGEMSVTVHHGIFLWNNSSGVDAVQKTDIGADCYMVDDNTVARTDDSTARSKAGTVYDVDGQGVWVRI